MGDFLAFLAVLIVAIFLLVYGVIIPLSLVVAGIAGLLTGIIFGFFKRK